MASERVIGMLRDKGAPFSLDELRAMSDAECWKWLYKHYPPKTRTGRKLKWIDPSKPQVCFTGHTKDEKERLKERAEAAGWYVASSVTSNLKVLCTGKTPGPSKLKAAQGREDTRILTTEEFLARLRKS